MQFLNQFASIYTVGVKVLDATMGGLFDVPKPGGMTNVNTGSLGAVQQSPAYAPQYTMAGGSITISAGGDIIHLTKDINGIYIDDSEREMPVNWLNRRGYVDPLTGLFGKSRFGDTESTTWWVDFSNFFEGVGALGGGNVTMIAGNDIKNVDALIPTNARMPGTTPDASKLLELGGGDLVIRAGHDINGGVYYAERGKGTLSAGNTITTNATRSPSLTILNGEQPLTKETWLPTTLFLGKGSFDVSARGDVLMGPVANAFLLPQGFNNTFWYKTWFSTYGTDDSVSVSSLGGTLTLRENVTLPSLGTVGKAMPALQAWFQSELMLSQSLGANGSLTASNYHPWLKLTETSLEPFTTSFAVMPGTLKATAFSGNINVVGSLTLSPSPTGTIDLAAAGAVNGLNISGVTTIPVNGLDTQVNVWTASRINLSDANPASIPGVASPFAYQTFMPTATSLLANSSSSSAKGLTFLDVVDNLFNESGSTQGVYGVIQTKQALHAPGPLHANDSVPLHLYAEGGNISGLTLFAGKSSQIISGNDITDIAFYLQNNGTDDVSVVSAARDIVAYNANTAQRALARSAGNALALGDSVQAGDIQINGPGTLEVLAGRNLDLGAGTNNSDGTGVGLTSIGNGRNPYLPFDGANIIAGAGVGGAGALSGGAIDFSNFISQFVKGPDGARYFSELTASGLTATQSGFDSLPKEQQDRVALQIFFLALRDAGRDHNVSGATGFGNYNAGFSAISALFPNSGTGNVTTQSRDIRTKSGGDIMILAPAGGLTLQTTAIGSSLAPPGIITEHGGNIGIFTNTDVNIGISRIFTLRGGDITIWSSTGNIAAGSSAKTVQSAPPTRVLIDPQSGDVKTDLAGLATGGGIGVLATVAGVPPGNVDLIAPTGVVDAGDAGIRATGNLNIAATAVLNASNISVGGASVGTPSAPVVSAPNIGGLTSASSTAGAGSNAAQEAAKAASRPQTAPAEEPPSIIEVEVLGFGADD